MKLSDKIKYLRECKGLTQEELAALCNVSRQSISKWESDISLPETDKLLTLADLFQVTIDILLRDHLTVGTVREINVCGANALKQHGGAIYEGALIKESIMDENILDCLNVHQVALWNTGGRPKYWTVLFFTTSQVDFPELVSKVLIADERYGGNWFVDFKKGNIKYIVFRNRILQYEIGNADEKKNVCEECRALGISDEQMNWSES